MDRYHYRHLHIPILHYYQLLCIHNVTDLHKSSSLSYVACRSLIPVFSKPQASDLIFPSTPDYLFPLPLSSILECLLFFYPGVLPHISISCTLLVLSSFIFPELSICYSAYITMCCMRNYAHEHFSCLSV